MGVFDKVKAFLKSEGEDLKDGLDSVKDKMDAELTKREQELAASPSERIEMMQDDMAATDQRFDAISDKVGEQTASAAADAEMDPDQWQDQLRDRVSAPTPPPVSAAPGEQVAPASIAKSKKRLVGFERRSPLLDRVDVQFGPSLDAMLTWVTAELIVEGMPHYGEYDHAVVINPLPPADAPEQPAPQIPDSSLAALTERVGGHPLVKAHVYEGGRLMYFHAPGLAPEDLQLLTAAALSLGPNPN